MLPLTSNELASNLRKNDAKWKINSIEPEAPIFFRPDFVPRRWATSGARSAENSKPSTESLRSRSCCGGAGGNGNSWSRVRIPACCGSDAEGRCERDSSDLKLNNWLDNRCCCSSRLSLTAVGLVGLEPATLPEGEATAPPAFAGKRSWNEISWRTRASTKPLD